MGLENFEAQISLRDKENREKYIGSDENWEKAVMLVNGEHFFPEDRSREFLLHVSS